MEFEYSGIVIIEEFCLREMYLRTKKGEDFLEVYEDVMSGTDDDTFFHRHEIISEVKDEINKRLKQSKNYDKLIK